MRVEKRIQGKTSLLFSEEKQLIGEGPSEVLGNFHTILITDFGLRL